MIYNILIGVVNVDIQEVAVNTDNDMEKYSVIDITSMYGF